MPPPSPSALSCPVLLSHRTEITVGHGGGGRLTQDLIERVFRPAFAHPALDAQHDGAVLPVGGGLRLAFTTDAHVVSPLFLPGGDIGTLAVNGTVNDLAMCGALPLWLSASFILEEGFPTATLGHAEGTLTYLLPKRVSELPRGLGAHDFGLKDLFAASALLGRLPQLHVYTISVTTIRPMCLELSPAVAAALPALGSVFKP